MLITEISEKDFRKLDLKVKRNERVEADKHTHIFQFVEKSLNDILDQIIDYFMNSEYEHDRDYLNIPVTIAIHKEGGYYLDKFLNQFTGAQTYQLGWGIPHLYSTRDYYESHGDYWKVKKRETEVIYRVHLEPRNKGGK